MGADSIADVIIKIADIRPLDPEEHTVSVHLRLPVRDYDDLYRRAAAARDGSVPQYIRRRLRADEDEA